ncbi:MAG: PAS domain S-box protein [Burkholderiales bacterium]|nr:PAS domain S-box protein [Burkholderiales bacterium]
MPAAPNSSPAGNPLLRSEFAGELARTLRAVLGTLLVVVPALLMLAWFDTSARPGEIVAVAAMLPLLIGLYAATRAGRLGVAIGGLVVLLIVYAIAGTVTYGSIRGAATLGFIGAVVIGGIFLDARALAAAVASSVLAVFALIAAQNAGLLPQPDFSLSAIHGAIWSLALAAIALTLHFARLLVLRSLARVERQAAEQRRAEAELTASEKRLEAIFRRGPMPVVITDFDRRVIVDLNSATERLLELGRDAVLGRSVFDFVADAAAAERVRTILKSGPPLTPARLTLASPGGGRRIDVMVSASVINDAGRRYAVISMMDVSGEEAARAALAASEKRFSTAFDLSPIGMTITRMTDGVILEVNRADEKVLGYTRAETIGRSTLEIGTWPNPDDREQFLEQLKRTGRVEGRERQVRTKDGRLIDVRVFATTIEIDGEPCVLAAGLDITAEKRMAREIRALNESLEARVRERTAELEAAVAEIESFSYSVSHDLRTPLRAIDGFTQLLSESTTDRLTAEEHALLARVRAAAGRMAHLIDDLLDLAKVGRCELRRESVDLSALAHRVAADLAEREPERSVEWDIEAGMVARCDAGLARILLENLIGNAWKFSARATAPRIRVGRYGDAWEVADNGAGFDMRYAERLFEPFVRLHREEEFAGTGIGLAIVKRIVARHGGHLSAEGTPGAGAAFRFTFNGG